MPHLGCPNDCVFCNQRRISGQLEPATPEAVRLTLEGVQLSQNILKKQIAFYGGSFTAIPVSEQIALLEAAKPFLEKYENASIRISTRPDCIDTETLQRLRAHGVTTVELGAQSMDNDVLKASGRGHLAEETAKAARLVQEGGFELILQMMTGLPGDTTEKSIRTAQEIIALRPDGVRIYPTVIIRETKLHEMWRDGDYTEHTVEDAVSLCSALYVLFEAAGIPIIRLGLNPTEDLSEGDAVGGAYHPAFGELVLSRIYLNKARVLLAGKRNVKSVTLGVSPSRVSAMVGHKRCNIETLQNELGIRRVSVVPADKHGDIQAAQGEIVIICIENNL